MMKFSCFLVLACCAFNAFSYAQEISCPSSIEKKIRVEVLRESDIAPYTDQIFLICKQVYREYPYLYLSHEDDGYIDYFKSLSEILHSIVCMAFYDEKVVGIATGIPIKRAKSEIIEAFGHKKEDLDNLYYLGELVLLPEYRKQGIGSDLYRQFEVAVKEMKIYSAISLCQIEDLRYESLKPPGYVSNDGFWKKLGFMHYPEYYFNCPWTNVNGTEESPHLLVFWIKQLH